jgi:hypothetical protein
MTLTHTLSVWDYTGLLLWDTANVIDARATTDGIVVVTKETVSLLTFAGKSQWTYAKYCDCFNLLINVVMMLILLL